MVSTEKELLKNKNFKLLKDLSLETHEYIIMGSTVLCAFGLKDLNTLNDIDLFVTQDGWKKVKKLGSNTLKDRNGNDYLKLYDGLIEIFTVWDPPYHTFEEMMRNALTIGGFNFISLEDLVKLKRERNLEKDRKYIKIIEKYISENH